MSLQYRAREKTTGIILHSSHTPPSVVTVRDYLAVHGRVMGLLEIGYHYVIERDGKVVACRDQHVIGSHTPGFNRFTVGICLAGGMSESGEQVENFTGIQLASALDEVDAILEIYGEIEVAGHTEIQRYRNRLLRCPGFDMDYFRLRLHQPHKGPRLNVHSHVPNSQAPRPPPGLGEPHALPTERPAG